MNVKNLLRERNMKQEQNRKKIEINTSEVEVVSMDDQLIQKAVALVELHIEDPMLSVEFLSKELGMSRVHLYKKNCNHLLEKAPSNSFASSDSNAQPNCWSEVNCRYQKLLIRLVIIMLNILQSSLKRNLKYCLLSMQVKRNL